MGDKHMYGPLNSTNPVATMPMSGPTYKGYEVVESHNRPCSGSPGLLKKNLGDFKKEKSMFVIVYAKIV